MEDIKDELLKLLERYDGRFNAPEAFKLPSVIIQVNNQEMYDGIVKPLICREAVREFYLSFIDELMRGCGDDKEFWVVKLINEKAKERGVEVDND